MRIVTSAASVLLFVTLACAQVPRQGLVAWYPFTGGSVADSSGSLRHPQAVQGVDSAVPCDDRRASANCAYDFYPRNAYGYYLAQPLCRLHSGLPSGNHARTVCFWVNRYESIFGDTLRECAVAWGRSPQGTFGVYFVQPYNNLRNCLAVRGFAQPCSVATFAAGDFGSITRKVWAFIAVAYDGGGQVTFSVNGGTPQTVVVASMNTDTSADTFFVGCKWYYKSASADWLGGVHGKLDDICIYNRALSPAEITKIYQANSRMNQPPVIANPAPDTSIPLNVAYRRVVSATDPEGATLTYGLLQGPTGFSIVGSALTSAANSLPFGTHAIIYYVNDADDSTTDTFNLTVVQPSGLLPPPRTTLRGPPAVRVTPLFDLSGRLAPAGQPSAAGAAIRKDGRMAVEPKTQNENR